MPDTKISHQPQGWIDNDVPYIFYQVRRLARDARRAARLALGGTIAKKKPQAIHTYSKSTNVTILGIKDAQTNLPTGQVTLSGLQQRLYDRLTNKQGVSANDALDIITSNGYNKAASYGHMRAAGATHSEADIVIGLSSPEVSLEYGKSRATGVLHTSALSKALQCQVNG